MEASWRKSSFSTDAEGNCIEIAPEPEGDGVLIRESDAPASVVATSREKLRAFLLGAKAGEFDHLV
ncbi:DUF397 domain-containing protein [Streptomyces sp. NPDC046887]|uniref:DUF397 domain-containing protein n=1 Tax=Streptomyces sp. NPDC046887 TaxID=3155472 RepID=UPI00340D4D04